MSVKVKAELSDKNPYHINKFRYYELKYHCLQYPIWKKQHQELIDVHYGSDILSTHSKTNVITDKVPLCAEKRLRFRDKMQIIEQAAIATDSELYSYILKGVTEGVSYHYLKMQLNIPCCRNTYYQLYRRFFWILDHTHNSHFLL
ncbi:MAG: hypothetical protein R3Y53_01810 [Bacillota bacterium]